MELVDTCGQLGRDILMSVHSRVVLELVHLPEVSK
jgi:hypothetical protein